MSKAMAGCSRSTATAQITHTKKVIVLSSFFAALSVAALLISATPRVANAGGEVTSIVSQDQVTSPYQYSADGQTFSWGVGREQVMNGFSADGNAYHYLTEADRVEIIRVDRPGSASGTPCSVFAERGSDFTQIQPSFPGDGSADGNCDLARMLAGRVVNRGALNVFSNVGEDRKNIERVDFIFDHGTLAPLQTSLMSMAGHLVSEKRGNNPIQIAAILELDLLGNPLRYGPLIRVGAAGCQASELCYGETALSHNYSFFASNPSAPNGAPVYLQDSTESVTMGFVSLKKLGLNVGQRYFGFSYFPKDVDTAVHQLTAPESFPSDTADSDYPGDGADIYGGMSGLFIADQLSDGSGGPDLGSLVTASVFVDTNGDGVNDDAEAGVEGITVSLYNDSDGNAVFDPAIDTLVSENATTDSSGSAYFVGVADGTYFLVVDAADPDLPAGIELPPGTEVVLIMTPLAEGETVNFAFGDAGSSTDGTTTDGTATDGSTTDGTATDGTSTDGTATDGATTDGTATDGATTDGSTTDGTATDGSTTDGTATDGTTTDGTSTDGTTTDGTATDGATTDGTATDGATTDGTATDGSTTDGTATDGTTTDGTSTDGTTTDGTSTDGTTTDGTSTDGTTTDGTGTPEPPNDDTLPVATNDEETAQQNIQSIIDVLANDIDPAQGGLTIVDVSSVENGTASIVEQMVVFNPALGFLGTTAFTYTIEDANGVQDSGTVSVTVIQFSDINDDGINDFDQCGGCTNLDLITGVHGSGLGSMSLVWVLVLSLFGFGFRFWRGLEVLK